MKDKTELKGIGGWLILIAIGVTLSPFIAAGMDYATYSQVFSEDIWSALTDSSSPAYVPYYALTVSVEAIIGIVIDAYLFYLIYLFYKKKSDFPSLYIKLVFVIFAFTIIDIFVVSLVFPNSTAKDLFDPLTVRAIVQSIFAILVWVPYMKKSVRVKNTFVN
jgi:hypothetical protein